MIVRKIKETDLEKLLVLYKHLHTEESAVENADIKAAWKNILQHDFFTYFVIEYEGILVSSCNITIIPNLTRAGRSIGLIENVVTHSNYRKKGFGRAVIETALDYAKSKNCYKVMLLSNAQRLEAHKFYESLGFKSENKVGYVIKIT